MSLKGKCAVVTGGSSGIGAGIAKRLTKEGCFVVLVARRKDKLEQVQVECGGPEKAMFHCCDVTQQEEVEALEKAIETLKSIDFLINCAGVMYFHFMKNQKWQEWTQQIDINCKGVVLCCGAFLPRLMRQGFGHIVNLSSDAAVQTFPALSVYNATKAFVREFTKGLRAECVGTGLRVSDIQPGDVRTELVVNNTDKEAAEKVGIPFKELVGGNDKYDRNAILDVDNIADMVVYILNTPSHVGIHSVLIEPRDQQFGDPTSMSLQL